MAVCKLSARVSRPASGNGPRRAAAWQSTARRSSRRRAQHNAVTRAAHDRATALTIPLHVTGPFRFARCKFGCRRVSPTTRVAGIKQMEPDTHISGLRGVACVGWGRASPPPTVHVQGREEQPPAPLISTTRRPASGIIASARACTLQRSCCAVQQASRRLLDSA